MGATNTTTSPAAQRATWSPIRQPYVHGYRMPWYGGAELTVYRCYANEWAADMTKTGAVASPVTGAPCQTTSACRDGMTWQEAQAWMAEQRRTLRRSVAFATRSR